MNAQDASLSASPWRLWSAQVSGLLRSEVKKYLLSKRAAVLYLLSLFPVSIAVLFNIVPFMGGRLPSFEDAHQVFANMFFGLIVTLVVYFACVITFTNLFRGEIMERSLHYYFLCPVRREVLVAGKYLSGQIACWMIFPAATILSYALIMLAYGSRGLEYLFTGPGLGHILVYMFVVILACLGYGAVFMLMGLLFRNPIIPAMVVFLWEWIHNYLPPMLQRISVLHYLIALGPVPIQGGPFSFLREAAPSAWVSLPSLLIFTAVILAIAGWRIRSLEISYSED